MFILLELIFQGFFEWVYGLVLECWNYFSTALLDIMSLDFAYIKTHVPVVEDIMQVLLAVGWALLLGNLVFQAIRSMASGLGFEGEDPKMLFARTFVFAFLLLASPQICEIGLDLTSRVMALLEIPDVIDVHLVDNGLFGTLTAAWLLVIICDIIIMFKVLKLLLEVAERYVILAVLSITAPLAFSMGGSKSTSEIFTGWCRMFGSMCLLMVTNVMFFKMLLSVVSTIPSGLDVFPWMVLIITIVKVAKKADEIITRIGLNPAITGDKGKGFGSVLAYTVLRSAASKAIHAVGAAATGGASAAAGAVAGGVSAAGAAGTAGAAGVAGAAGAAGAAFRSGTQRGTAQQSSSTQTQEQRTESAATSGVGDSGKASFGKTPGGDAPSRKSSVPSGARRAASYVSGSTEKAGPASSGRRTAGGFGGGEIGGGAGRRSGEVGVGVRVGGGSFARGSGRDAMKQSGRNGAGRLRPVTVLADNFDDGVEEKSKVHSTGSTGAAGGRNQPGPAGTPPSAKPAAAGGVSGNRAQTTIKGSSTKESAQTEARSTRRDSAADAATRRFKDRSPSPAKQEKGKGPTPPGPSVKGGGPAVRPGPAGTTKGQADQTRTTKAPGTGGPGHGQPK